MKHFLEIRTWPLWTATAEMPYQAGESASKRPLFMHRIKLHLQHGSACEGIAKVP